MSAPASKVSGYMPQLDGLRAVCVFMVFVAHWIPSSMQGLVPWGNVGVDGFFVLSGFLITGILLGMREETGAPERSLGSKLRVFMIRRGLRIFPAYFLLLGAMWVLGDASVRTYAPWCWTYTVNILVCRLDGWVGTISHLWSLALEEQFYLVWPLLMLLVPWRWVFGVLVAALMIGVVSRLGLVASGHGDTFLKTFPLSSLDFFAIGGILAWLRRHQTQVWGALASHGKWLAIPCAGLLIAGWLGGWHGPVWRVVEPTLMAVAWGAMMAAAAQGLPGILGKGLQWPPVAWLGQISYGLYLIHNFMPNGIGRLCAMAGISGWPELHPGWRFVASLGMTVSVASISYYLVERPLLRLKDRWK